MAGEASPVDRNPPNRRFLFALIIAVFATVIIDVLTPLLLTYIAETFSVSVAVASQVNSASIFAGVIIALLMGALSVRFKHKILLMIGVLCIIVCSVGSFLAPNFFSLMIFYPLNGVGSAIVSAMSLAMVGEFYALEKRGKAIGLITATGYFAFIIALPITNFIANMAGWRFVLLWFVLPFSVVSLFECFSCSSFSVK